MNFRTYTIKELKRIITESSNEFKGVIGDKVTDTNKKNNEKPLPKEKNTSKKIQYPNEDNLGMQDIEYDNISPQFKSNVQSQMKGYSNSQAEKLHKNEDYGNAEFNEIEGAKERHKSYKDKKLKSKKIGLTSREIDKKEFEKLTDSVFEAKKIIRFKNTVFLTESQVLNKIPDDLKFNGSKFTVIDKNNNIFNVIWNEDKQVVLDKTKLINENERIHNLFNYKNPNSMTSKDINENENIKNILDKVRLFK